MKLSPSAVRRAGIAFAAAVVAVITALGVPAGSTTVSGSRNPSGNPPGAAVKDARRVERSLGNIGAGMYFDRGSGRFVVNITAASAANEVRDAGATPRAVDNSDAELARVTQALGKRAPAKGVAWGIDPATNTVLVSMDQSVSERGLAKVTSVTNRFAGMVKVDRVAGRFTTKISGGQAITGSGVRCSLGFNVRSGSTYYFLTAGHCTDIVPYWYTSGGSYIGPTTGSSFPGDDYGIARYDSSVSHPGNVYLYPGTRDITYAANPYVGQSVRRSGSTTGVHSGYVQALNVTVRYAEGTVYGLIQTNVCAEPGDSGGSLFAGNAALGLTSGGSGNCSWGGTTFFQPVTEPLSVYGVSVY